MKPAPALPMDVEGIRKLLMHRYPFLLVDRIVECELDKRIVAYKNVTINEPFFNGHFPEHPVMPGVLVLEALAQAGGLLTQLSYTGDNPHERLFYLVKIDNARFNQLVVPGDRLELHVSLKRVIRNMSLFEGVARVDGKVVASAEILCAEAKG